MRKEKKAAAYLAKTKGVAMSALTTRTPVAAAAAAKASKVSMYKYVAYHKKKGGWVVQVTPSVRREKATGQRSRKRKHAKAMNFCGRFPDKLTAAQKPTALSGIPLSQLEKG